MIVLNPKIYTIFENLQILCVSFQNIRVMAKYYTRITLKRMGQLLDLSIDVSYLQITSTSISEQSQNLKKNHVNMLLKRFNLAVHDNKI